MPESSQPPTKGFADAATVAVMLSVSTKTVRRYIASGRLDAVRIGPRLIRIDLASVEALSSPIGWAGKR